MKIDTEMLKSFSPGGQKIAELLVELAHEQIAALEAIEERLKAVEAETGKHLNYDRTVLERLKEMEDRLPSKKNYRPF